MKLTQLLLVLVSTLALNATEIRQLTVKENCILSTEHKNADNNQLKTILMSQVKRDAIEELFGTMLKADTLIVDGKLISDKVKQVAVGSVRIKGIPKFYNGKSFGEVCTKAQAYITQEDYEKYQPQTVKIKKFCYNNPDLSVKLLQDQAQYAAYKKAIMKFKPSMKKISNEQAESYIHGFEKTNETLDIQTGVLCMDFSAKVFPYELELGEIQTVSEESLSNSVNGLLVVFYQNKDYALSKPIYKTTMTQDLSLFKKVFTNAKIQKDRAYYIQLKGFIYANVDRYATFMLKSDVYNVEVKINNKRVLNKYETKGGVGLKAGYNPVEILLTSSNAYDIELLEKQDNGVFTPLSKSKLFIKE